jgi:transcriptional regulator with XRE-family HTH domain
MKRSPISNFFRDARLRKGWSQDELARRTGIHSKMISHIETGVVHLSLRKAYRLCQVLEVDLLKAAELA